MKILALDFGSDMGWCYYNGDTLVSSVIRLKKDNYSSLGSRFLEFRKFLEGIFRDNKIDIIYYERVVRHIGSSAAHNYGGYLSVMMIFCEENNVEYLGIGVNEIKKRFTGKGVASKDKMVAVAQDMGYNVYDHNEVDAIAVMWYALDGSLNGKGHRSLTLEIKKKKKKKKNVFEQGYTKLLQGFK